MIKTGLPIFALAGAVALGSQFFAAQPAHAACMDDAMMVKEEAMGHADGDAKSMAIEHVAMATEKATAGNETECMAEVTMAKEALAGDAMAADSMEKKKTN